MPERLFTYYKDQTKFAIFLHVIHYMLLINRCISLDIDLTAKGE